MADRTCLAIVLAAGEGTRMRSSRPKVLHEVGGRSLLAHVLDAVREAGCTDTAVVIGPDAAAVGAEAKHVLPRAEIFVQTERRGTAHAVLAARSALARGADDVLVIFGDTPLIQAADPDADAASARRRRRDRRARLPPGAIRPAMAGSCMEGSELVAIREEHDATPEERAIGLAMAG